MPSCRSHHHDRENAQLRPAAGFRERSTGKRVAQIEQLRSEWAARGSRPGQRTHPAEQRARGREHALDEARATQSDDKRRIEELQANKRRKSPS